MNQHFDAVPHIIRDEEDGLILTYGPMSAIATLNEEGALALISIYIDTRDEDEATDELAISKKNLPRGNYHRRGSILVELLLYVDIYLKIHQLRLIV